MALLQKSPRGIKGSWLPMLLRGCCNIWWTVFRQIKSDKVRNLEADRVGDFVTVLKLSSREICFHCKPNRPLEERRSSWFDSLLNYVKPYTNILFCIFPKKYFVFYIFYFIFFSAGKACVTLNHDFWTPFLEKIVHRNVLRSLHELQVASWK